MKIAGTFLSALLLGALAHPAAAATLAESHFDSTAEGWTTINDATFNGWQTGGFIQATDQSSGQNWYFSASTAFLGNKSTASSLSFDLMASNTSIYDAWDVVLYGNNITLVTDLSPTGMTTPSSTSWTNYSVSLTNSASWIKIANNGQTNGKVAGTAATAGELSGVLADLDGLYIRGEYKNGGDTGKLDNVVMTGTIAPVPEPETYAMLLAGLGLLGATARRRRTR